MLVPINFADIRRKKKIEKKRRRRRGMLRPEFIPHNLISCLLIILFFFWLGAGIRDEEVDKLLFVCWFVFKRIDEINGHSL